MHGVLTSDNLFDGTIVTNLEQYYIEPAARYGPELERLGVHTVIYKLSDVKIRQNHHSHDGDRDGSVAGSSSSSHTSSHNHSHSSSGSSISSDSDKSSTTSSDDRRAEESEPKSRAEEEEDALAAQNQLNQKSDDSGNSGRTRSTSDRGSDRLSRQSVKSVEDAREDEEAMGDGELVRRKRSNRKSDIKRRKRWLPEEVSFLEISVQWFVTVTM